mmetsp:Transcript_1760/g.2681  ORF Transcript_1760/g.2681 Transcript_1760/m.2681 type:complete len:694 (+) Transcript_1760:2-2083(+)
MLPYLLLFSIKSSYAERCDVVRGEVSINSSLKLGITKNSFAPYELSEALPDDVISASKCPKPVVRDVLVAAGGTRIFNGSLEEAAVASVNKGEVAEFAFPLVEDDIVKGFIFARFERVLFAETPISLQFAQPKARSEIVERELRLSKSAIKHKEAEQKDAEKAEDIRKENDARTQREREKKDREREKREEERLLRIEREREIQRERDEAQRIKNAQLKAAEKRRQALQAVAHAAESNLDGWARQRSSQYEWINANFEEDKGSMGMAFDAQTSVPPATVSQVNDRRSPAFVAGVRPGDQLVELRWQKPNDDGELESIAINTTQFGPSQVRIALQDAQYPRQLVFFRELIPLEQEEDPKSQDKEEQNSDIVLRITAPAIARGTEFSLLPADWGSGSVKTILARSQCTKSWHLALADPVHGCTGNLPSSIHNNSIVALAARGVCTFVDKARALQKVNASIVLIYNNAPTGIAPMPSGSVRTDDITIPVLGLSQTDGILLAQILRWNDPHVVLTAWIGPASQTCSNHKPLPSIPIRSALVDDDDDAPILFGHLEIQCRGYNQRFRHVAAAFGPLASSDPIPAALTRPSHLCGVAGVERRLSGMAAIVNRGGGCGFGDKVLVAQKLGAAAVIVLNHKDKEPERMMADPAFRINIPAVMATDELEAAFDEIAKDDICAVHGATLVRIVYDPIDDNYDTD